MSASSFISAMLRSRWVFSITLAASATLMLLARCTPAVMTLPYSSATLLERGGIVARHDLHDLGERALLVAGVDALGRVADVEILQPFHAGVLLQDRDADLLGGAGIDGRFVDDDRAALHVLADRGAGADQRREIRDVRFVDRRRHGDDDEVGLRQIGGVGGDRQQRRGLEVRPLTPRRSGRRIGGMLDFLHRQVETDGGHFLPNSTASGRPT